MNTQMVILVLISTTIGCNSLSCLRKQDPVSSYIYALYTSCSHSLSKCRDSNPRVNHVLSIYPSYATTAKEMNTCLRKAELDTDIPRYTIQHDTCEPQKVLYERCARSGTVKEAAESMQAWQTCVKRQKEIFVIGK